jgi:hypothetical protein
MVILIGTVNVIPPVVVVVVLIALGVSPGIIVPVTVVIAAGVSVPVIMPTTVGVSPVIVVSAVGNTVAREIVAVAVIAPVPPVPVVGRVCGRVVGVASAPQATRSTEPAIMKRIRPAIDKILLLALAINLLSSYSAVA